jgi:hypothetical protein
MRQLRWRPARGALRRASMCFFSTVWRDWAEAVRAGQGRDWAEVVRRVRVVLVGIFDMLDPTGARITLPMR